MRTASKPSFKCRALLSLLTLQLLVSSLFGVFLLHNPTSPFLPKAYAQSASELRNQKKSLDYRRNQIRRQKLEKQRLARYHESSLVRKQRELYSSYQALQSQQNNRSTLESQITTLGQQLDQTYGEIARLERATAQRLRNMYMGGRLSWVELLFTVDNINSLLDLLYYRKKVVAQDKSLLRDLKVKTRLLAEQKQRLAQKRVQLDTAIQSIQSYQTQIAQQVKETAALRQKYLNDAAYYEQLERQLLAESANISRQLARLAPTKVKQSTGQFIWPVQGRISSNFGYRRHPIRGRSIMHTGLDIAAPQGRSVSAADGGEIFFAGWRGGYGKAIIINHGSRNGKSYATLYGHLSSINVSTGQSVTKGQVIGRVGSTGHSTGPHLHFEVRVNGSPVNPMSYL